MHFALRAPNDKGMSFPLRAEVSEALLLLSTVRVVARMAEAKRHQRLSAWSRARQTVEHLGQQLDRLQLALLHVQVMRDQTLEAALLRQFNLLLLAREVDDAWQVLHQDLLALYPEIPASMIEAVRKEGYCRKVDRAPLSTWPVWIRRSQRLLRHVRRVLEQASKREP